MAAPELAAGFPTARADGTLPTVVSSFKVEWEWVSTDDTLPMLSLDEFNERYRKPFFLAMQKRTDEQMQRMCGALE